LSQVSSLSLALPSAIRGGSGSSVRALDSRQKFEAMKITCERKPHGTRLRYVSGCKCMLCRAANSRYECDRAKARNEGDWNGIVDAGTAREFLLRLARKGIGRRSVGAATGISDTILFQIRNGTRRRIRARTERLILQVDESARGDKTLVPGKRAWKILDELLNRGYSKTQLAAWLGSKARIPALQINRPGLITARSESRVERLYTLINAGKLKRGKVA